MAKTGLSRINSIRFLVLNIIILWFPNISIFLISFAENRIRTIFTVEIFVRKQRLFLCLKFLHCGVWTVNSGFVFGGLVPCPYSHIPGTFLYVCKGYNSRTYLPTSFPKKQFKKVFHLYRYKKSEKLSPENQIFQKNLRAAETAPKREKKVILLYRTAEDQTSNRERKWNSLPTACCFSQLKQGLAWFG